MAAEEETPTASSSGESGCKLFLGGLSWDTTEEKLSQHFGEYGEIVEAVVMRDRTTARPRGFGFVTFKDRAVADRVVQDIHVIDGRQIDAKKSVPQEQKPKARKIFVGGLAPDTTEADFKEYFEQYGPISDAQIMQDHMTGRSRGFGFITFEEDAAVERVFAAGAMQELGGKRVEIKHATPKGAGSLGGRGGPAERGGGSGEGGGGGRGAGGFGRAAPLPYGQVPGSPYGFGMFPYPPGVMPPHAAGPYSLGYPSPYLMMQQISGFPGGAGAFAFPPPGSFGARGGLAQQQPQSPGQQPQQQHAPIQGGGGGFPRHPYHHPEQQAAQPGSRTHGHMPYPRPLAGGGGRGKGKVDSASELSEHSTPSRYMKS